VVIVFHRPNEKTYDLLSLFHLVISPLPVFEKTSLFFRSVLFAQKPNSVPSRIWMICAESTRIDKFNRLGCAITVVAFFAQETTVGSISQINGEPSDAMAVRGMMHSDRHNGYF
jgi:hypothetical protein